MSPGSISSFSATLGEAGAFSTTCLVVSATAWTSLTTGNIAEPACGGDCSGKRDSRAVNGLAGSVTKEPSPCLVTTRP